MTKCLYLSVGLIIVSLALWRLLISREERLGRSAPLTPSEITPQWIEQNLTSIPAEVAGAAWDEDVDRNEVSALLARWVAEGKVRSMSATSASLSLELIAPRETFEGYEREHAPRPRAEGLWLFPTEKGVSCCRPVGVVTDAFPRPD